MQILLYVWNVKFSTQYKIVLDDICSVSCLVKFKNSGILKAAQVRKLITDKVVLTGVLMVPGLTRNLVLEGPFDGS